MLPFVIRMIHSARMPDAIPVHQFSSSDPHATVLRINRVCLQLAAGDEHNIGGKAVKVNRAGPRPAPQLVGTPEPGRLHPTASTGPLPGGITRQQGGHALPERIPPRSTSVPPGK